MIRLFEGEGHAESYSRYRPTYPDKLFTKILTFLGADGEDRSDLAMDIACGTGQSTAPLAAHFQRVIGQDVSAAQIEQARHASEHSNIEYRVGPGEDLSQVSSNSVDLITSAAGLHWLDLPMFYAEVKRVLKPGGVLAAYCYRLPQLDNKEANQLARQLYYETLGDWMDPRMRIADNAYQNITLPFDETTRDISVAIRTEMTIAEFAGFVSSLSCYNSHIKARPESEVLTRLERDLRQVYGADEPSNGKEGGQQMLHVTYPVFCLMGRKPSS